MTDKSLKEQLDEFRRNFLEEISLWQTIEHDYMLEIRRWIRNEDKMHEMASRQNLELVGRRLILMRKVDTRLETMTEFMKTVEGWRA